MSTVYIVQHSTTMVNCFAQTTNSISCHIACKYSSDCNYTLTDLLYLLSCIDNILLLSILTISCYNKMNTILQ